MTKSCRHHNGRLTKIKTEKESTLYKKHISCPRARSRRSVGQNKKRNVHPLFLSKKMARQGQAIRYSFDIPKEHERRRTMNTRTMLRESDALPRRTSIRRTCMSGRSRRGRVREGRTSWNRIWGLRGQTEDDSTNGCMLEKASFTPSFKALSRLSNVVNFQTTLFTISFVYFHGERDVYDVIKN